MEKRPSRAARAALGIARVTNAATRLLSGRRSFGADYPAVEPQIIDWAAARSAFNPIRRVILERAGVDRCLRLRCKGNPTD